MNEKRYVVEHRTGKSKADRDTPFVVLDSRTGIVIGRRAIKEAAIQLADLLNERRR
jgi:hypothetical protein